MKSGKTKQNKTSQEDNNNKKSEPLKQPKTLKQKKTEGPEEQ